MSAPQSRVPGLDVVSFPRTRLGKCFVHFDIEYNSHYTKCQSVTKIIESVRFYLMSIVLALRVDSPQERLGEQGEQLEVPR